MGTWTEKLLLGIDEKTDEELAEETEQNAIILRPVDDFIFSLLLPLPKTPWIFATPGTWLENGCFGCGETEKLLIEILELELKRQEFK